MDNDRRIELLKQLKKVEPTHELWSKLYWHWMETMLFGRCPMERRATAYEHVWNDSALDDEALEELVALGVLK